MKMTGSESVSAVNGSNAKRLRARGASILTLPLLFITNVAIAMAACGQGAVPKYGDINAIEFERANCFGSCQSYQVLITNEQQCYYIGIRNVSKLGSFQGACSPAILKRAIAVLERNDFYNLNYDSSTLVLDAPHYVISAERCGVTTKLDWPVHGIRKDIETLLMELDTITDTINWHRVSSHPQLP